jgi:hypothetical protein
MSKILTWLQGKKTYIVAAAAILTAIGAYLTGTITGVQLVEAIFAAIGTVTMRAGIAKTTAPVVK